MQSKICSLFIGLKNQVIRITNVTFFSQNHDFYVKYLQPLRIKFVNPKSYPSQSCTHFTLDCSWLTQNQLEKIREKFLEIWEENGNNVILFSWISEIKDGLQITDSELNLDPLIPKKKIVEEYEGILVKFLVQRGFGFIFCPATNCQYFVHRTNMNFTPNGMALVSFFVKPKKTQLEAIKVKKCDCAASGDCLCLNRE